MSKTINGLTEDQQAELDLIAALDETDAVTALLASYDRACDQFDDAPETLREICPPTLPTGQQPSV